VLCSEYNTTFVMKSVRIFSILIIVVASILFSIGCRKEQERKLRDAVITGWDGRDCLVCCGGLMLEVPGDPYLPPGESFYLIENEPAEFGLDNPTFPVHVRVTYLPTKCGGRYVHITAFERK
jgi:hypothetical protein